MCLNTFKPYFMSRVLKKLFYLRNRVHSQYDCLIFVMTVESQEYLCIY
jgi:hypothetical protein